MTKRHYKGMLLSLLLLAGTACEDVLKPKPIDLLTNDVVLNEPRDVANVELGLYSAVRNVIPAAVIAGDFTADHLIHNGTFPQYRELGTKHITSSNTSVQILWQYIYNTIYIANFILERLPQVEGVPSAQRNQVMGTAYFLRGYAFFVALYTYGGVPLVTTSDIETNRNIPRSSAAEVLAQINSDYTAALGLVPEDASTAAYISKSAVQAGLARLNLYLGNWSQAESYASAVIDSKKYTLESDFATVVTTDLTSEAIFEVSYLVSDDPGTDGNIGLNNLFAGRREIIPSNEVVLALSAPESGSRFSSIKFDATKLGGVDNGWSVAKYGTADENNNNVVAFRLPEMYLIRAEARAQQEKTTGDNSAQSDINVLRARANAPTVGAVTKSQMLRLLEEERRYELAFEGHRWYDLVRTGRANAVMSAFSPNWREDYNLWPIPQRELQNNPAIADDQNPGY
ncbi:RagB/SusD family nutrient uptake outer membrane protein [Chryseolinea sp. T2]|uniref:RagB/SusD family nutrient uptake outer membrane protein n=1 Tax=Chryseolinea sp. T2 TaxID=3129255 RepID=UPI003077FC97